MGVLTQPLQDDLDVSDATFDRPDLTTFARLDELGLEVIGQRLTPERAVLACRVVAPDRWCRRCGCEGAPRDTIVRRLAHEPLGWRPTTLLVTVRRYNCRGRTGDPLYAARRVLHTGADLLTAKQKDDSPPCSPSPSTPRSKRPGAFTNG